VREFCGLADEVGQLEAIRYSAQAFLGRFGDIEEKYGRLKARIPFIDSFATDDHSGHIFTDWIIFRTDRVSADPDCELCPERKTPARLEHDPILADHEVAGTPEATIDPVVEINREVRVLGIT
jgi:hypothetical protein